MFYAYISTNDIYITQIRRILARTRTHTYGRTHIMHLIQHEEGSVYYSIG